MKKIALSKQGKNRGKYFILVDDEDFDFLNKICWSFDGKGVNGTIKIDNKIKKVKLHRFLMNPKQNQLIDHKDRNPLNNQKNNLRFCSNIENCWNQSLRSDNKSGFRGVCFDKSCGKWAVTITINKKQKWLGYFSNIKEAAKAYNKNAKKYFGEFANLNKI